MSGMVAGSAEHFPPLAPKLFLPDGQVVDTTAATWVLRDISYGSVPLEFAALAALQPSVVLRLQHTFGHFLETRSVSHSRNLFGRLLEFYRAVLAGAKPQSVELIEFSHLLIWQKQLTKDTLWKLGVVRILLEKAARLGYGFCSGSALDWLGEAVLPGNPKGGDVQTRDPNRGAFTAAEVETLNAALNDAYAEGEVDLPDYAAGHVLLAFGVRSRQLAALKEKDLIAAPAQDGEMRYILRIPQAKQRGELTRGSFRARPCDRRLGRLLERLIAENAGLRKDPAVAADDWPMFISSDRGENPPGFAYHQSARTIASRIRTIIEQRTQIRANSKRFRHTLAQNMADDGASRYEIAEALGHTDTQQVGKYLDARPEMVPRLNHLAEDFAPIMQAFAGILISREDLEARTAPKTKRLHDRTLGEGGEQPLGHCGQHGFCDLAKPVGCYTCRSFRPWDDGPHEEVLTGLRARRQEQIDRGLSSKIYTINDRTIAAVTRVVQLCRQRCSALEAAQEGSR
ncbi:site-specific integrase [Teichococcus aerofrigidensis]